MFSNKGKIYAGI